MVQIWSPNTPESGPNKSLIPHLVDVPLEVRKGLGGVAVALLSELFLDQGRRLSHAHGRDDAAETVCRAPEGECERGVDRETKTQRQRQRTRERVWWGAAE